MATSSDSRVRVGFVWSFRYDSRSDRHGRRPAAAAFPIPARTTRAWPFVSAVYTCKLCVLPYWPRLPLRAGARWLCVHTSHTDYHYQ